MISADPLKKEGVCGMTFRISLIQCHLQKGRPQTSVAWEAEGWNRTGITPVPTIGRGSGARGR